MDNPTSPTSELSRQKMHAGYARTRHRDKQHDSAHAEPASHSPQRIIDHPLIPKCAGELITTQPQLEALVQHVREQGSFAYDSEFIGELSYHARLCVLQVATTQQIGLVDPLVNLDLTPLWNLLSDPSIEKILHAGEQDIEPVHRLTGKPAANVFDTQIAAGFTALAYPIGLSKLVHELLGVKLGKGLTFTHWDQRPLSPQQLIYAADDVRYLPAIRQVLGKRLAELGHQAWSSEECNALCDPARYGFDPETYYTRIRGANSLSSAQLSVLRELTIWRDAAARSHDMPARAFLKDEILLDMSRSPVKSVDKLARVKGLPRPVENAHGATIVDVTLRALAVPTELRPQMRTSDPSPSDRFGGESLFVLASSLCAGKSIDPALVTSRQEVADLHRLLIEGTPLPDMRLLTGWRRQACGEELVRLVGGKGSLELTWKNGRLNASK